MKLLEIHKTEIWINSGVKSLNLQVLAKHRYLNKSDFYRISSYYYTRGRKSSDLLEHPSARIQDGLPCADVSESCA